MDLQDPVAHAAPADRPRAERDDRRCSGKRLDSFLTLLRPRRRLLSLAIDGIVIAACWNITYLFRLGFERWLSARPGYDPWVMLGIVALYLAVFVAAGVPRGMWRFSGFGEIKRLTLACLAAGLLAAVAVLMAQLDEGAARGAGAASRRHADGPVHGAHRPTACSTSTCAAASPATRVEQRRALVLGAGDAARLLLAGIQHEGWVVVGLLDDDPLKQRSRIGGVPILGPLASVKTHVELQGITHLVLAMPGASAAQRRRAIELAADTGLPVLTVPSAQELLEGGQVSRVRDIEPEDLLGREPVQLDEAGIAELISGKTVLVTGAGGSIGSELCRQVARYGPARLVLYELGEYALYQIEQQLSELHPHLPLVRLIGDVKNLAHLRATFAAYRPQRRLPRRGVQARAADGGRERLGGAAEQHARHLARGAGGGGGRRRALRADLDRQGGEPDQRDGRHQARRRDGAVAAGDAGPRDALRRGALRQRARLERQRDPEVHRADRPRRAGDGDAPRHHALLHDHPRGGAPGAAGRGAGRERGRST